VCRIRFGIVAAILLLFIPITTPLRASRFYILEDYYNLINGPDRLEGDEALQDRLVKLNLEGEIQFNLRYGKDFSLKKGTLTGAGSAGISDGFAYDLVERILLTGSIGDRIFIEFDFDSEREEEELGGDRNTYQKYLPCDVQGKGG
jgi:hypothetical protein